MAKEFQVGDTFSLGAKSREMRIKKIDGTIIKFKAADESGLEGKVNLKFFDRIYIDGKAYDPITLEKLEDKNV